MSDFSDRLAGVRKILMQNGARYSRFTSNGTGATDGTTIIAPVTGLANAWAQMDCTFIGMSGLFAKGESKVVESSSGATLTFTNNPWRAQVGGGEVFELTERGLWEASFLREFILKAAQYVVERADNSELFNYSLKYPVGASIDGSFARVDLPTNVVKFTAEPYIENAGIVNVVDGDSRAWLELDTLDAANPEYVGYYEGRKNASNTYGSFVYKPAVSKTVVFSAVPIPTFDTSDNWKVPPELNPKIDVQAAVFALKAKQRHGDADSLQAMYEEQKAQQ